MCTEAAFYLKLMSDDTTSNSRHLTRPTSKSLDDITGDGRPITMNIATRPE